MRIIKQSTARDIMVLMVDSTDHVTGKTGLTLTITASKNGGAFASISPTVTERTGGWYSVSLTASHTDTLGDLALRITGTAADPTDILCDVRSQILGDNLSANVTQFGGNNGTFDSGRPEVNTTHVAGTSQTAGDLAGLLAAIDDYIDSEVAAIKAKTDNLPSDPADASDISSSFGTVNATLSTIAGYLDTEIAAIKAKTDNLPASPAATGDIPSAATIADAVWDEAIAGHLTAGTTGAKLNSLSGGGGGGGDCPTATEIAAEVEARLAGQALEVVNPYPAGGTIRTIQGTAYKAALGNRIEWPDANATWPVLTDATITVKVQQASGVDTFTGVVITATGTKRVGLELEEADTTGITVTSGNVETSWRYIVTATMTGGDIIKLAEGKWISVSQPS